MNDRLLGLQIVIAVTLISLITPFAAAQLCTDDNQCSGDDACIAGRCISPVPDRLAYTESAMLRDAGYIRGLQFPALFDPSEECCFDLDGDGSIDDAWGAVLALTQSFDPTFDPQGSVDIALADGQLIRIIDWRQLPSGLVDGEVEFSVFGGVLADGVTVTDMAAGLGSALLDVTTFGSHGALDQFNLASISSGILEGEGNQLNLPVFATTNGSLDITLRRPVIEAPLVESPAGCSGVCTVDEDRPGSTPSNVWGGKMGGLILLDDYMASLDQIYRTCSCAGVDPTQPVFTWGANAGNGTYDISCTDPGSWDSTQCPTAPCSGLNQICSFTTLISTTADIDSDGDSINDAWSVGLRFSVSGTTIVGLHGLFFDDFESGDTAAWSTSAATR